MTHLELTLSPAAWTAFIDHMFEKMQRRGLRDACTCKIFRKRKKKRGPVGNTVSHTYVWQYLWP